MKKTMLLHRRAGTVAAALLVGALLTGCGDGGGRDLSLDKELARSSLAKFLDSWKQGQTPAALESADPPITGRDVDWDNGLKLADYKIESAETVDGSNLHLSAALTIQGQPQSRTVTYVVGTSPVVTVFRAE